MIELDKMEKDIEEIIYRMITQLKTEEEFNLNSYKMLTEVNKALSIALDRRKSKPKQSWADAAADEELENEF